MRICICAECHLEDNLASTGRMPSSISQIITCEACMLHCVNITGSTGVYTSTGLVIGDQYLIKLQSKISFPYIPVRRWKTKHPCVCINQMKNKSWRMDTTWGVPGDESWRVDSTTAVAAAAPLCDKHHLVAALKRQLAHLDSGRVL